MFIVKNNAKTRLSHQAVQRVKSMETEADVQVDDDAQLIKHSITACMLFMTIFCSSVNVI